MFSPRSDGRLQVQIPALADDKPSWTKVGVIAAIGFLVGVAWPRVAGVRLGPSIPADATSTAAASASPTAPEPSSPPPSAPAAAIVPGSATPPAGAPGSASSPPASATAALAVNVSVGHGNIFACKTSDGDTLKGGDCGTLPGLDGLVMPRLRNLGDCPDAATASGKMHVVMHIDFKRGALSAELGRGQGISNPDAIITCAREDVKTLSLMGVPHDNPRYSVAYTVTFGGDSGGSGGGTGASTPGGTGGAAADGASAEAQVVWEVAIVRDAPKTGKVVARLQRGAAVHLGSARDGWYPVKFGDGFGSDGWLYRGAVGR